MRVLVEGLVELGFLTGSVDGLIEQGTCYLAGMWQRILRVLQYK